MKLPFWKQLWLWLLVAAIPVMLLAYLRPLPIGKYLLGGSIFLAVIAIAWFFATAYDRYFINEEKKHQSQIAEQVKIFEAITGEKIYLPVYDVSCMSLHYLNSQRELERLLTTEMEDTLKTSRFLSAIKEKGLKVWLLSKNFHTIDSKEIGSTDRTYIHQVYLCYGANQPRLWLLKDKVQLIDLRNKKIMLKDFDTNDHEIFTQILKIVSDFQSVDEVAFNYLVGYGVPLLDKTKASLGKSKDLEQLRIALGNPLVMINDHTDYFPRPFPKLFDIIK